MFRFYKSAYVERWHNRPEVPGQTTGLHSFGMLLLLMKLHPNPSANLMQAIIRHDLSEIDSGDFPHKAKNHFPVLREIDAQCHNDFEDEHGLPILDLTEDERLWIKYLDQLEPLYYLKLKGITTGKLVNEITRKAAEYRLRLAEYGYF